MIGSSSMSTGLDVVTEIDGGLGSDTFFVGGNPSRAPVAVVSNDLRGHSGILLHRVESSDSNWDELAVEGLSANVGDDEEAMILLAESGGRSLVVEGAIGPALGATDTYRLRLSRAPQPFTKVVLAVVPAGLPPEDEAKNFADLEIWDPHFVDPVTNVLTPSWRPSRTIELTPANWSTGVEILFRAKQDVGDEGRRFTFINHKITEETTDVTFLEAQTRSLKVQMEDDDRDGVIVVPSGRGNTVLEGGFADTFDVVLSRVPAHNVTITVTQAGAPGQIRLSDSDEANQESITLTFTPANWNTTQTITVSAANDGTVEGFHTEYLRFDVSSADGNEIKGPFTNLQVVKVNGTDVAATLDVTTGKVWLQMDGDLDDPGIDEIPGTKPSTFVLLPHRPIPSSVKVRVANTELAANRFSVTGNTVTFLNASGAPEFLTGKVEVNYQYNVIGYDHSDVRDQVVDIYDNDTPTVIIQPAADGMLDVVENDGSAIDTYSVRLGSAPLQPVQIVIDSVKTRTTWGASAYFEKQLLLSDSDETDMDRITLTFTPANWAVEQTVTVRAFNDDRLDGNDTQVFAPDLQTVNKIRGPLIVEGAAGAGSLTLPAPLMMPWELNIRPSAGNVVAFVAADSPAGDETMTVELQDLEQVVEAFKEDNPTFTLVNLVGKTLEMSKGEGTDVVLDPNRPEDKFDRFWLIRRVEMVPDDADPNTPQLVTLTLSNPAAVDPTQPNVTPPDTNSEYAITSLSVNFFADEREQVDYLFVYDNESVADDVGALTSADGVVRGFDAFTGTMTVETSALQRTAELLGLGDLQQLEGRQLTVTVGPGTGHVFVIVDVAEAEGDTKELTLSSVSGAGAPTNRSEFRIEGSDRYGRITGFGMGPNILFSGRPQGGGITYGDLEVVQVELGLGDDTVHVDYATNAEDHATRRTGDYYTLTILNTGGGNDQVTVALDKGDSTSTFNGSDGDGAFALNTADGDDIVQGASSTRPLVVFGGAGADDIVTGSGDDIVFGDLGRVDYTKKIDVDGSEYDAVITRLGSSVPQNPENPHVTFATNTTISDNAILGTPYEFPIDDEGLVGLSVQVISPEGHVQFRTVIANTADTITVDAPWEEFPVYDAADPNDNYYYRISSYPDDQTDGLFRGPRVIWTVQNETGDNDTIHAGNGTDIVIGGAGDDPLLDGGGEADYVLGDDARFDFLPVLDGPDGTTRLVQIADPGTSGDDVLVGGDDVDLLIGGLGNDTLSGLGDDDLLIGDDATVTFDVDGVTIVQIETTNRKQGGTDLVYGGVDQDILIGGTNDDTLDGGSDDDLILGDNGLLELNAGSGDAISPRFRTLTHTTLYDANGNPMIGGRASVPGGSPTWADWTITLDPSQNVQHFGDDYIAGGADDDQIFGQLGNDVIQGDGSVSSKVDSGQPVAAARDFSLSGAPGLITVGSLQVVPSIEAEQDGDDYIEGNEGADVIFGNLGQDDIVGGSSSLFSLVDAALRVDASDLVFGGAGRDILRNHLGEAIVVATGGAESVVVQENGHARDADVIVGDNGNIYRIVSLSGSTTAYRSFAYDDLYGEQLVVRAVEVLDYTPGGSFGEVAGGRHRCGGRTTWRVGRRRALRSERR